MTTNTKIDTITIKDYDGALCPVFICAQCHQPIQGPGRGLIQWDSFEDPTAFTVLHKGPHMPCSRQWDQEHGKTWKQWRPLDKFDSPPEPWRHRL